MPRVSAWLVRVSLVHLVVGSTAGALLLAAKGGVPTPVPAGLVPVHREVVLVGWMVQFVLGVGFWVLPPARAARVRGRAGWWVLGLLNAGVALSAGSAAVGLTGAATLAGRGLEAAAILLFAAPVARKGFR